MCGLQNTSLLYYEDEEKRERRSVVLTHFLLFHTRTESMLLAGLPGENFKKLKKNIRKEN